jgi:hypothetical protein
MRYLFQVNENLNALIMRIWEFFSFLNYFNLFDQNNVWYNNIYVMRIFQAVMHVSVREAEMRVLHADCVRFGKSYLIPHVT